MSSTAVCVENLSKRYLLGHQSAGRTTYTALRDVIGQEARTFARKAADFWRGRQIVEGDRVEEFWALRGVSFEVKEGEVLGIIGRNGAGKSTLLKILSRITEPNEGRAILQGRVASLLEVGTGFHHELTGRENIFLNGAILGMSRVEIRRKFDEIVTFSEVERFLDTPVKRYSSGMYVRLAFAVAAHLEPEILIVDEVLAVGDAEFQKKCLGKMGDVARSGRTVLFVSHNLTSLRSLCSQGMLLTEGRVRVFGNIDEALSAYTADRMVSNSRSYDVNSVVRRVAVHQYRDGIVLELEYSEIRGKLRFPGFGFVIHDVDGRPILGHNPLLERTNLDTPWPDPGVVRARLTTPKLLDGVYIVSVFFGDDYVTLFSDPTCLIFPVAGLVNAPQLSAQRVGPVYPECRYEFAPIHSKDVHVNVRNPLSSSDLWTIEK